MSQELAKSVDTLLLAAGFGKRLRPLTDTTPKPLVKVNGRPLIEWNLDLVLKAGLKRVFVNTHHLSDVLEDYFEKRPDDGLQIELLHETPAILETGGAINNLFAHSKAEYLLTINSDALFGRDLDLRGFCENHIAHPSKPLLSMLLRDAADKEKYGLLGFNSEQRLISFLGEHYISGSIQRELMYTGVQVFSRDIFSWMPEDRQTPFSLSKETYPKLLSGQAYVATQEYQGYFNDVGTPERLALAEKEFHPS